MRHELPPGAARAAVRRLVRRVLRFRGRVALSAALAALVAALGAASLSTLLPVLEAIFASARGGSSSFDSLRGLGPAFRGVTEAAREFAGADPMRALGLTVGVLLVLRIAEGAVTFLHDCVVASVSQRVQNGLAEDLFDRLTEHDEATLARIGVSHLTARFTYDLDMAGKAVDTFLTSLVLEPLRAAAYLGFALLLSPRLTLLAVVLVPGMLLLARLLGRRTRRSAEGMLGKRALLLGRVQETVAGLPIVQVYGQEERERKRFRELTTRARAWAMRYARLEATNQPALEIAAVLALAPVLLYGGHLVLTGETAATHFLGVLAALLVFYAPLRKAVGASNRLQGGIAGAMRIFEAMDLEPAVREARDAVDLPPLRDAIEWRGVTVVYPDGRTALRDVTLTAPAGRTTAIVGPSGAGKTTLLHTLVRLVDPAAGAVLLDGRDVRRARLASLRGRTAIVTQDARLFAGTLAENVAYGRPGASREEVERAGRAARVDEIVARLPEGWDTRLDELGAGLSGGERQRVAIARAMLRDPEILLLDEPTSALDPENERLVAAALADLCRGRTALVVAHRRSTVEAADHAVVLCGGRVEAEGPPGRLPDASPTYRELFGAPAVR